MGDGLRFSRPFRAYTIFSSGRLELGGRRTEFCLGLTIHFCKTALYFYAFASDSSGKAGVMPGSNEHSALIEKTMFDFLIILINCVFTLRYAHATLYFKKG